MRMCLGNPLVCTLCAPFVYVPLGCTLVYEAPSSMKHIFPHASTRPHVHVYIMSMYVSFPSLYYRLRFEDRAVLAKNPMGKTLFELMVRKKTNLSVAVDVETVEHMLDIADKVKAWVCRGVECCGVECCGVDC